VVVVAAPLGARHTLDDEVGGHAHAGHGHAGA
jgi:hypothetical protein